MKCPYCGEIDSKVIDSRPADDGERIRRRRECLVCQKRFTTYEREITSIHVGELAMQELKNIDEVAYVRFASVYRQFGDINTFMDELKDLLNKRATQGRDTASEDAEK